jgi:AAA+ ATPase superfamily predicted ATPase
MTADYTYLNQLTIEDLLDRARQVGPDNHLVRALADRLEEYADAYDTVNTLQAELGDAERRAEGWRDEAQALQRQLDMVRG